MSWLSSAFEGNFKPLTSGIANVTGISKTPLAQIGGKNTVKDLEIGGGLALGGLGLAGLAGLGPAAGLLGGTGEALGFGGIGEALGFGGAAEAAGGAGALAPGSLDALSATGNLAGAVPAGASAAGVAAPSGIGSALGLAADPTAAAANPLSDISSLGGYNSIDAAAGQPGINGFAGAAPIDGQAVVNNAAQLSGAGGNAPAQGGSFLLASGLGDSIAKNPLGVALGAGGLGYNILQGQKQSANVKALEEQAQRQNATGAQLESYLTSGTLPAGLQTQVTQAVQSAKANAISNAAAQGLSTDPTKNTALAATLAQIDAQTPQLTAQIGQQLMQSGVQASGLSSQTYTTLANIDQTQTAAISKAVANMAAALSGRSGAQIPGTNLSVSQAPV